VEYRILGPLEVVDEGEPVALGRLKERLVLAILLLHANEFVARERLIDELWGESPPPTARKAVNVYVSQLRKVLVRNGRDPITTADGGYRLEVDVERLDAAHLQQLLATARERAAAGELEAAVGLLREALDLWRGPTLAGLLLESHGRDEIAQLDEMRLTALMDRIDCDLALGRHEQVLGELQVLVGEHPLRERLRAQQMLALYRAGRQAEALEAYQQAREVLVEELGIEPSPALQRLQQGILRHDPSLETASGTAAANGLAPTRPFREQGTALDEQRARWPRVRVRRRYLAAAALVLLAAAAGLTALATRANGAPRVVANSLVRLDPASGKVVSVVRVGVEPGPIAITPTAIWTSNYGDNTVSRYPARNRIQTAKHCLVHQQVVEQLEPTTYAAVSLAELYAQAGRWDDVIELTEGVKNADNAAALLCVFRGQAFREQGFYEAAHEALKEALRSRSRAAEIRHLALAERAQNYLAQGKKSQARKDLERILAEDSDYEGVREQLAELT
jgi:DNA-binding SARP family transcriptional activator